MDGQKNSTLPPLPPPPAPPLTTPFLFTPSSSLHLPLDTQVMPDIDWVSLLSGQAFLGPDDQSKPVIETSLPVAENGGDHRIENGNNTQEETLAVQKDKSGRGLRSKPGLVMIFLSKVVKNSNHQRSYYRCTHHTCNVKKKVQRLAIDSSIVMTTYEGIHNHPCEKLVEALIPLLKQMQFLSRF